MVWDVSRSYKNYKKQTFQYIAGVWGNHGACLCSCDITASFLFITPVDCHPRSPTPRVNVKRLRRGSPPTRIGQRCCYTKEKEDSRWNICERVADEGDCGDYPFAGSPGLARVQQNRLYQRYVSRWYTCPRMLPSVQIRVFTILCLCFGVCTRTTLHLGLALQDPFYVVCMTFFLFLFSRVFCVRLVCMCVYFVFLFFWSEKSLDHMDDEALKLKRRVLKYEMELTRQCWRNR